MEFQTGFGNYTSIYVAIVKHSSQTDKGRSINQEGGLSNHRTGGLFKITATPIN